MYTITDSVIVYGEIIVPGLKVNIGLKVENQHVNRYMSFWKLDTYNKMMTQVQVEEQVNRREISPEARVQFFFFFFYIVICRPFYPSCHYILALKQCHKNIPNKYVLEERVLQKYSGNVVIPDYRRTTLHFPDGLS